MRKLLLLTAVCTIVALPATASAKKAPALAWQVSRTNDPITGATSCIVAAYDRAAGLSFSRTGALYPFVENSSTLGLLVGVSSGGRMRLPTGDIVWRVDDRPFRTLRAADNPVRDNASPIPQDNPAMSKLLSEQMRLIAAATATSTVASGETARAMLDEMLAGQGLVFRSVTTAPIYGLPTGAEQSVGQVTAKGLRPYPLDESLRAGITACGITRVSE